MTQLGHAPDVQVRRPDMMEGVLAIRESRDPHMPLTALASADERSTRCSLSAELAQDALAVITRHRRGDEDREGVPGKANAQDAIRRVIGEGPTATWRASFSPAITRRVWA